jgi:hypothetical protein
MKYIGVALMVLAAGLWFAGLGFQDRLGIEWSTIVLLSSIPAALLGLIALAIPAAISILKGEVALRPWKALKPAILIFLILMTVKLLASEVFSAPIRSWAISILGAAIFGVVLGLYQTAEEKPA